MNWVNERIPPSALVFLLPLTMLEPPAPVIAAAGDGGLLSFLLGFLLAVLAALAAALVARGHPGRRAVAIFRSLFGRVVGTAVAAGYALFWLAAAAWLLRVEAVKVNTYLLPGTPVSVVMLSMLLLAVYLVAYGAEPVTRWSFVVLPAGLLVALVFYVLGFREGSLGRLLDLPPAGAPEAAREGWRVAGGLEGVGVPLALAGFFTRTHLLPRAALGGMAIAFVALGVSVAFVIAVWGVRGAALYHWPAVAAVQTIVLPGFVVEKLDLVYVVAYTMLGIGHFIVFYLLAAITAWQLAPSLTVRTLALALALPLLLAARLPPHLDALDRIRAWLAFPTWAFAYLLPAAALGLSHLRLRAGRDRSSGAGGGAP